jgi:DNA-binding FrmR family transcriptional regulator
MAEEGRYCVYILTQLHAVVGAIQRIERSILQRYLENCFAHSVKVSSEVERSKKIEEVIEVVATSRKTA